MASDPTKRRDKPLRRPQDSKCKMAPARLSVSQVGESALDEMAIPRRRRKAIKNRVGRSVGVGGAGEGEKEEHNNFMAQ